MGVDITVVGTKLSGKEQIYWHKCRLCNEILQTLFRMGSITFSFLKVREAVQKRNVTTKWGTLKGGGAAPTIKKSLIQNVDCFEMRANSY